MLAQEMHTLVEKTRRLIESHAGKVEHHVLCCEIADEFELWGEGPDGQMFPIWLSRVVEGEQGDYEESVL